MPIIFTGVSNLVLPTILMLLSGQEGHDLAVKFAQRLQSPQGYSCNFQLTNSHDSSKASGSIAVKAPYSINFQINAPSIRYQYLADAKSAIEINHTQKTFWEFGPLDHIYIPSGKFSAIPILTMPVPFVALSLEGSLRSNRVKYEIVGREKLDGVDTTHVKASNSSLTLEMWFNAAGDMLKYIQPHEEPGEDPVYYIFRFSGFGKAGVFNTEPPLGYEEYALRRALEPLPVGAAFPPSIWATPTGVKAKLEFRTPTLVIFTEQGCSISAKLAPVLKGLSGKVSAVTISSDGQAPPALANLKHYKLAEGDLNRQMGIEGTPILMLVGKDGKIKWVDMGFQPGSEKSLIKAILEKVKS